MTLDTTLLRWLPVLFAIAGGALVALGDWGLAVALAAAVVLAPRALRPLAAELRAEWPGALALGLMATSAWRLDDIFGTRVGVFVLSFALGAYYLWRRRRALRPLLRHPLAIAFAAFLVQEMASAAWFGVEEPHRLLQDRAMVALTLALIAALPGRRLAPAILLWSTMLSVPIALAELVRGEGEGEAVRAGGFYDQPNVAGIVLVFGLVFAILLRVEGTLGRRGFLVVAAAYGAGIFATASRGAFATGLAVIGIFGLAVLIRRKQRGLVVAALTTAVCALAVVRAGGDQLVRGDSSSESRLEQVVLALSGNPDALLDDDSHRFELVSEAWTRIAAHPVLGYGTGAFMQDELRSHVQFLEVLGENGIVGGLFYAAVLAALIASVARARHFAGFLLAGVWIATHFHNHNIIETPCLVLPLGWALTLEAG